MKIILAPIDFSDDTRSILEAAGALAAAVAGKIILANVFQPDLIQSAYSSMADDLAAVEEFEAWEQLTQLRNGLKNSGMVVETCLLYGEPAASIRQEALHVAADYIVIGSHRPESIHGNAIGSTVGAVLKEAPCPVLVVPVTTLKPAAAGSRSASKPVEAPS
jgi:nucleotide-binding universal stress UspA family protein